MLLSSSLEPSGPKSAQHYIVLHHSSSRELIKLPKSYSDLQREVGRLFHIDPDRFHVETKELNLCAGERIRIPRELWSDIAELLGNVYVTPHIEDAFESHPESHPDHERSLAPIQTSNKGLIPLIPPLQKEEFIAFNLGSINFAEDFSSATELHINVLDESKISALTIRTSPGSTTLASTTNNIRVTHTLKEAFPSSTDHHILIYKQETWFQVLYDMRSVGTVEAPAQSSLSAVAFDLGDHSPFKGPVSVDVYPDHFLLSSNFGPYRSEFPPFHKDTLYRQILASDPRSASHLSEALRTVRKEITLFGRSSSGIIWKGRQVVPERWSEFEWDLTPDSACIIRFSLEKKAQKALRIVLGRFGNYSLQVGMGSGEVNFGEHNDGTFEVYHKIKLEKSILAAGDHSVAFLVHNGQLHASFDLKQSTIIPKNTLMERGCLNLLPKLPEGNVEVDLYNF